jgi:HD-GYP domain-containing protein (c-di-GMP phosphodiesterase class II)
LQGEEISLRSRIFAVADTVDAMTTERPYRAALTFEGAVAELSKCSGIQFDKRVVEAFRSVPLEFWINERKQMDQKFIDNDYELFI